MENSRPLATDSFSYSWLIHRQPKFLEDSNEDFNFHVITSPNDDHDLVHADEIFSNGQIKPSCVASKTSTSLPATPVPPYPSTSAPFLAEKTRYCNLRKWKKSSKKILQKFFGLMKPLRKSRTSSRVDDLERKVFEVRSLSNSVEASPRTSTSAYSAVGWNEFMQIGSNFDIYHQGLQDLSNWRSSPNGSPSRSSNVLCDAENSIHEAILYCKRSIGK